MGIWLFDGGIPSRYGWVCRQGAVLIGAAAANWQGSQCRGKRRAATTRPRWPSSSGARRGDHPVAYADQVDYVGKHDGRETILLSRSRVLTMLFGRLEAAGAPRWADGAVGERRWAEREVSRCAVSGSTHFAAPFAAESSEGLFCPPLPVRSPDSTTR